MAMPLWTQESSLAVRRSRRRRRPNRTDAGAGGDDCFAHHGVAEPTIELARGCRVITVSSGGVMTILGWLRTSSAVTGISLSCCLRT